MLLDSNTINEELETLSYVSSISYISTKKKPQIISYLSPQTLRKDLNNISNCALIYQDTKSTIKHLRPQYELKQFRKYLSYTIHFNTSALYFYCMPVIISFVPIFISKDYGRNIKVNT